MVHVVIRVDPEICGVTVVCSVTVASSVTVVSSVAHIIVVSILQGCCSDLLLMPMMGGSLMLVVNRNGAQVQVNPVQKLLGLENTCRSV